MSVYAYADPPYPGKARSHYGAEAAADGRISREVNHRVLIGYLCDAYPDGWALSTNASTLQDVLALCPAVRIAVWCKPFAVYKVGVNPGYCWEPVILRGGRKPRARTEPTVRDYLVEPIKLNGGEFRGAKPPRFTHWVLDLLGVELGDQVDDLFPGTGGVGHAIDGYLGRTPTAPDTLWASA